ncbi:MAG: adenylate kinase [Candidatus Hadarchaeota archaeon]
MSKVVVVTGVPGSGKSTVVDGALKKLEKEGVVYLLMNYGDAMLELMKERHGVTDRDEMRKVPTESYRGIQREAGRRIAEQAKKNPVLVDTHCLVKKPEGYYPGLPLWVLEELKPELIIIVEASAEEIGGRRSKDAKRMRDKEMLHDVDEHQQLNRAAAMAYAAISGATVRVIQNRDKGLNDAVMEMVSALR